jgi:O-antigen/teichoic acid export membrane protein
MQKKFITNLALLLLLNLLIKPFWILGIDRAVQNAVLPGEYGLYYALFNFSFLLNILLDFGITNFNNKNIAQNNHLLGKHLSSIVFLRMMLGGLYMIASLAFAALIGYRDYDLLLVAVMGANQFLASFILYLRSNLAGLHLFKTDSIISVLDRLIMILFCALLLWGGVSSPANPFQIEWYIYSQTAAYLITVIITLLLVFNKAKIRKITWRPAFFMVILKKSYPYAILVLLMTFYNRVDAVMLERLLPDGEIESSIYASAYRLLDAANMIAYLFAGLLLPIFARMIKLKHRVEDLVKLAFSLLMVLSFTAATGTWYYSSELTGMLYTHHTEQAAAVLSLLMGCFIFVSTTYVFGTLLTANGNLKELNIMAFSGMILNIGLNFILIPLYKATGSAASSLITQGITAIAQVILAARVFRFKNDYVFMIKLGVFFALTALAGFLISSRFSALGVIPALLLLGVVAGMVAFGTRLIHIPRLLKAIREEV